MKMILVLGSALLVLSSLSLRCDGYRMTRCELVRELRKQKYPEIQMRDWVCLVENESERRTDVISKPNKNGSRDHGLFQINDKWWCSNTTVPGKDCHVTCADLRTDDITKACVCAKFIWKRQGFHAWHGWEKRCQGELPDISMCDAPTVVLI